MATDNDASKANELREKLKPLLSEICDLMNDATKSGLTLNFNIGLDATGRANVNHIQITKAL